MRPKQVVSPPESALQERLFWFNRGNARRPLAHLELYRLSAIDLAGCLFCRAVVKRQAAVFSAPSPSLNTVVNRIGSAGAPQWLGRDDPLESALVNVACRSRSVVRPIRLSNDRPDTRSMHAGVYNCDRSLQ
jgi:hypothetical protein